MAGQILVKVVPDSSDDDFEINDITSDLLKKLIANRIGGVQLLSAKKMDKKHMILTYPVDDAKVICKKSKTLINGQSWKIQTVSCRVLVSSLLDTEDEEDSSDENKEETVEEVMVTNEDRQREAGQEASVNFHDIKKQLLKEGFVNALASKLAYLQVNGYLNLKEISEDCKSVIKSSHLGIAIEVLNNFERMSSSNSGSLVNKSSYLSSAIKRKTTEETIRRQTQIAAVPRYPVPTHSTSQQLSGEYSDFCVVLTGLPQSHKDADIRKIFYPLKIKSCKFFHDTQKRRWKWFLTFSNHDADIALSRDGSIVGNCTLHISKHDPGQKHPASPRPNINFKNQENHRTGQKCTVACKYFLSSQGCKYGARCFNIHASESRRNDDQKDVNSSNDATRIEDIVEAAMKRHHPDLFRCSICDTDTHKKDDCPRQREKEVDMTCSVEYNVPAVVERIKDLAKKYSVNATFYVEGEAMITSSTNNKKLKLSGKVEDVELFQKDLDLLLKSVVKDAFQLSHVGAAKLFSGQGDGQTWLQQLTNTLACHVTAVVLGQGEKMKKDLSVDRHTFKKSTDGKKKSETGWKFGSKITCGNGDIAKHKADLLISSTATNFQLDSGAISKHLLSVGGAGLQADCDGASEVQIHPQCPVKVKVAANSCVNLPYQEIIHATLPAYDNQAGGASEQALHHLLAYSLGYAETSNYSTIALPPIGTGNLNFPLDVFCQCFCEVVETHFTNKPNSPITHIYLVAYEKPKAQQAETFIRNYGQSTSQGFLQRIFGALVQLSSPTVVTQASAAGGLKVTVSQQDITQLNADVIVTSNGVVRDAVLKAAGAFMATEFKNKSAAGFHPQSVIETSPGGLTSCQAVYHINCQAHDGAGGLAEKNLAVAVRKCLDSAQNKLHKSIAFPAAGTGNLKFPAQRVAEVIFGEVDKYKLRYGKSASIQAVAVVSLDTKVVQALQGHLQSMQKGSTSTTAVASSSTPTSNSAIKSPPKRSNTVSSTDVLVHTVKFIVWALSSESCKDAKDKIIRYWNQQLCKTTQKYGDIIGDIDDDLPVQEILGIASALQVNVSVVIDFRQHCITMEGYRDDMSRVKDGLMSVLIKVSKAQTVAEGKVQWEYVGAGENWKRFDIWLNLLLEEAWEKQLPKLKLKRKELNVDHVNLHTLTAVTCDNQKVSVRRCDLKNIVTDIPPTWDKMDEHQTLDVVTLNTRSLEYSQVSTLLTPSVSTIIKIERVQNPRLYRQYCIQREHVAKRCHKAGEQTFERQLYHGTSEDTVRSINERGFDRSFSGKNGVAYGQGTYFAVNPTYSVGYARANGQGEKKIYLCLVLTGQCCGGNSSTRVPPLINSSHGDQQRYDTTVDNQSSPGIYVVYNDSGVYPQYLITFT